MALSKPRQGSGLNNNEILSKLLRGPCTEALLFVYKELYSWDRSKPEDLADHLEKYPNYDKTNKKLKNYLLKDANLNKEDIISIKSMKDNNEILKTFDVAKLYKVSNAIELVQFGDSKLFTLIYE